MRRLLLIDPEHSSAAESARRLASAGFDVTAVANASRALQFLRTESFAAILCEIHMPRMDGFELRDTLLREPALAAIPFCFIASQVDAEERELAGRLGARGIVSKPVKLEELRALGSNPPPAAPRVVAPIPVGEPVLDLGAGASSLALAVEPMQGGDEIMLHCTSCDRPYAIAELEDDRLLSTCPECLAKGA